MEGDQLLELLGLTSEDHRVKSFLVKYGFKAPKLKRGDIVEALGNKKLGIDVSFRDERHLDVKNVKYDEGVLVLNSLSMYGSGHRTYKPFRGELPLGLNFEMNCSQMENKLTKRPDWKSQNGRLSRWDFREYCVFISTAEDLQTATEVSIQLPLK